MMKFKICIVLLLSLSINICNAQVLTAEEQEAFKEKCEQLALTFCGYIEELTEENSNTKGMTINEFYDSEICQFTIGQMRKFFAEENLATNKIIGYTPNGKPPAKYTSVEGYIKLLLNQRKKYRTVRYDFSAFVVTELVERTDADGKIYYEGEVKFQNFLASKNHEGSSEKDWEVFHEDFKKLTFKIDSVKTKDGKFFAITFHKLEIDFEAY